MRKKKSYYILSVFTIYIVICGIFMHTANFNLVEASDSFFSPDENFIYNLFDYNYFRKPKDSKIAHIDSFEEPIKISPNDPYYSDYQASVFSNMKIPTASSLSVEKNTIVVAVIDTGVDAQHPDLIGKILTNGYNFVADNSDTSDDNGHGTMVAGIISANANNSIGVAGAAGCYILPIKSIASDGFGTDEDIAAGIKYAADQGADIINISCGGSGNSKIVQINVNYAYSKGCVIVAAAGNAGEAIYWPANCMYVIAVGAISKSRTILPKSNYGRQLSLVAIGDDILSTYYRNGVHAYAKGVGTSFAASYVSSLAASVINENTKLSPDQVRAIMEQTATDLGSKSWDQYYGYGLINFEAAMQKAQAQTDS